MSDAVVIAIVAIIPPTVASITTAIVTIRTHRNVKGLREDVKREGQATRAAYGALRDGPGDASFMRTPKNPPRGDT